MLTNPSDCEGEDCLSVYKCNPAGTATYECSKPLSTPAKHSIPDEATCADGGDAKTLDAHMTCLVGGLVAKAQKGELDAAALTDVERIIISSLTLPEQSVLYTGTIAEIQTIAPIFTDSYSKFLQKSLLHAYVQSVVGATRGVLKQAERIEDFEASAILGKIEQVEEQLRLYDVERQETLAKVRQGDTWENIVKMYRESSAKRVMQLNSEAR